MGIKASAQYTIAEIHEECNVVISNESHVFRADKNNTAVAGNTSIQIYGYQGSTQIATTVGTISGLPSAGMTATISNNGKTNTSIIVAVTTALTSSVANNGVLTIPITVAGKTINKTFSWSKAQTGATGATGGTGAAARTYWVTSNANTVTRSMKGTLTPTTITFGAYYRDGTSATSTAYSGRFIIQESTNGTSWTTKYTSSANESSKVYTPTKTTNLVKCTMYAAGGTTNALDALTIGIVDSIDDLEIGGTNLLRASDFKNTTVANSKWSCEKCTKVFGSDDAEFGTYMKNVFSAAGRCYYGTTNVWKTGQTYAFSFYAKTDTKGTTIRPSRSIADFGPTFNLTTSWQRFSGLINCTTTAEAGTFSLSVNQAATIYITKVKLEVGNSPSKWSPAPEDLEDIEERIEEVNKSVSEVIVGTQTAATNVWTGVASFSTLADGQQISYWLPYAGNSSAATLNLTLAGGTTTGAKNLYYGGTTRITTHYPAGSVIHLTYRENVSIAGSTTKYTGWWADANYNTDTYDRIRYNSAITALAAISSGRVIAGTASGFKHIAANTVFNINKPILLAGSAIAANATGSDNYIAYSNINLASTKSGFTGTKGKTVYIVGTLNGTTFTPNSTVFTTTEPTTADGLVYIALGLMSSTTNSTLYPEHPLYKYVNGKFQSLSQVAYEAQDNLDNLSIGGRNYIYKGRGNSLEGYFKNFNSIEDDDYAQFTMTFETASYKSIALTDGFLLTPRDYEVGKQIIYSYDIMYKQWDFGEGATLGEFWMGQRYSSDPTGAATEGAWRSVTVHALPKVGVNCELNEWVHVSKVITIPEQAAEGIGINQVIAIQNKGNAAMTITLCLKNVKIEYGNKETDWTPAPEDTQTQLDDKPSRSEVAENISNNIDAVNTTTDQKIAASIKETDAKIEDVKGGFATQVDGVRQEVDAAGNVIRELENYATKFLITSNGMQMNIEKEKGANLIKNSVMIQHRDSSSGVQANYWDGFNTSLKITNAQIPNLASTNDGTSRANTDSGNYFSLDFTKNTSSMKYACLISNPIDFKLNASNILLSYKIRERSAINGKVFVGLIFYKNTDSSDKEISSKLCADLGTISTSAGFANARYVPVTEYSTGTMGNVFTEKVMYKTLPISRTQTAIVEESLPIQVVRDSNDSSVILEKYVTLSYTPDSSNSTVTLVNYNGTTTGVTPTGTKVPLELNVNNDYVAVRYTRKLSNYVSMSSPTSAKIITELGKQNATDIKIYYDSSTKKIWVFNPFTGTYIASSNLYSDTIADTDINTVRVVIGAYGSAALTGIVDFSDLKLEYDTISTLWSSHQNEIYGKEYKMDEYGFSITTDTNQMFIDEDEIAAYEIDSSGNLKTDDPVFQIKKENTILRRTVIHNELLIENETTTEDDAFIMKQQKVGSKWFYIFY